MLEILQQLNYVVIFVAAAVMLGLWAVVTQFSRSVRKLTAVRVRGRMEADVDARALLYARRWKLRCATSVPFGPSGSSQGPSPLCPNSAGR